MSSSESYTVSQAIDTLGFGQYQIRLSVIIGVAYMADAMEMMILSVLAPALHCHWHITQIEQASLTTVVFLGMMLSSAFWGTLADKYGRKPTLVWTSVFLFYFGFLTAFSPTFQWVLFLRFMVGFFIGGVPQASTLYAEFQPSSVRGKAMTGMSFYWACGAVFLAILSWIVMPSFGPETGWRYLIAFSTFPLGLFTLLSPTLIPESLQYLATSGDKEQVIQQLNNIARINKKPPMKGTLRLDEQSSQENRGRIQDLFLPGRRLLSLQVLFLWFVGAGTYYGAVLLSTEMLNSGEDVCLASGKSPIDGLPGSGQCSAHQCQGLNSSDYVKLVWTTFAEFPGSILCVLLIDTIGRRKTLAVMSFGFAISTLGVVECAASKTVLVILLFCSRGFATALLQCVYVYTSEAYPTYMRAAAIGTGSGFARIGAMLTPYIAQVLLKTSLYSAVTVYAIFGFTAAINSWFLPIETAGLQLNESGQQISNGRQELVNEEDETNNTTQETSIDNDNHM